MAIEAVGQAAPLAPEHREKIERLVRGELEWVTDTHEWLRDDRETLAAFLRLMLQAGRYMDVLKTGRVARHGRHRSARHALAAMARHHARWIRPPEAWHSTSSISGHPRVTDKLSSLAGHLLGRYPVPKSMEGAWFEGVDDEGLRQQEWYIRLANGVSARELDMPIRLTRRMAHIFVRSRKEETVLRTLRWAQVIGMGGDKALAGAILNTRLGRKFDDDGFWSSVVLFLVNNAMMDHGRVGPLVDYIHHMKYAPRRVLQEGGGVELAPPPQPDFTMKGRSATKLLRQVEGWHGHLNREKSVTFESWNPSAIRPYELEEETPQLGAVRWTVQELLSSWELAAEGRAMNHCVVSYADQCAEGKTAIWSIGLQRRGAEEREHVLTVAVDIAENEVTQARGRYNALPHKKPRAAKLQQMEAGGYLDMLNRSDHILGMWIERERLRRSD